MKNLDCERTDCEIDNYFWSRNYTPEGTKITNTALEGEAQNNTLRGCTQLAHRYKSSARERVSYRIPPGRVITPPGPLYG